MILLIVLALSIVAVLYALVLRPWLLQQPWAARFFAWIEPVEIKLWKKSETIFLARFKMAIGLVLTLLTMAGEIDVTPLMPIVPDAWEPTINLIVKSLPMLITVVGWVDQQLRYDTTKPVELVAIAEKDKTPEVIEALAAADTAKDIAVETAVEAKAA